MRKDIHGRQSGESLLGKYLVKERKRRSSPEEEGQNH